jgi:hypothetical protein
MPENLTKGQEFNQILLPVAAKLKILTLFINVKEKLKDSQMCELYKLIP